LTDNLEYIIKGCIAGKNSSREMLYKQYSGKMWAICLRYAHDHDEAKDILQDGFMKIFEKISQFEGRGHFEGWMRKIMVNTALAVYRKKHFLNIETSLATEKSDGPSGQIESNLSACELLEIINRLSPQYKIVFNLYAIEGYSHKEISEMLGISEGTSKSNLSRARYILQKKVSTVFDAGIKLG
jgi:RNA polymerase sigma-70 factor (ECF subfamily)